MKRLATIATLFLLFGMMIPTAARFAALNVHAQQSPGIQMAMDMAIAGQDGVLTLYGAKPFGGTIGLPVASGDLNGDGLADVAFGEMYASADPAGVRVNNGKVNVYLSNGSDTGIVDASAQPTAFQTIIGQRSGDLLGEDIAFGDVTGDGLTDMLVAATGNAGPDGSRTGAGAVYLIPGSKNFTLNADLQTSNGLPPAGITAIYGPQTGSRLGIWVETGDVDGDGIPDILIGADQLNTLGGFHAGGAFIIFGSQSLPGVIDLASPPAGVRITTIMGASTEEHWGSCLHAGDLNADGIADVVISAALDRDSATYVNPANQTTGEAAAGASDGGTRTLCGEVYVLYGSKDWPAQIDLRSPPAGSTHIIGAHPFDFLGSQTFSADINGDGKRDLIVGAIQALAPDPVTTTSVLANPLAYTPPSPTGRTGAVYIIYGSSQLPGATIDMLDPSASGLQITAIYGEENEDCNGDSVRAYDINNDGMADLFIGSPGNSFTINGVERVQAGDTKLIYGQPGFLPPVIKMYDPPASPTIYRIAGAHGIGQGLDGGDVFSYRFAGADVDGDGYTDYIVNAMRGDGPTNNVEDAGQVYVISGKKLSATLGLPLAPPAPVLSTATLSLNGSVTAEAPAGQPGLTVTVTGSGISAGPAFTINGVPVNASLSADSGSSPQAVVNLDQYLSIRNTVGALTVQARNTQPASALSNEVVAGSLTGPEITSASLVHNAGGAYALKVLGQGFKQGYSILVTGPQGAVPVKSVSFISAGNLKAKIKNQSFASGSVLSVAVQTQAGVNSNQFSVTTP